MRAVEKNLAKMLRELRLIRGVTGQELARKVGMSQSKISKIETGLTIPSVLEVEKLLNILEASSTIRQQILSMLESANLGGRQAYSAVHNQPNAVYKREYETKSLQIFAFNGVPVLLQTLDYRRALMKTWDVTEEFCQQKLHETMRRQDLLWDLKRRFHFIVHETALYTTPGSRITQVGQLDRLERFIGVDNIKLGIVPVVAGTVTVELGSFVMYDQRQILWGYVGQEFLTKEPQRVAEHEKIFTELSRKADYGDSARESIRRAVRFFG